MLTIYRDPVVTLIGRPQFVEPAHLPVQWKDEGTDGEKIAEFAGRLCYMSQSNPAGRSTAAGRRAKDENSSTMRPISATWRRIVSVHLANVSGSDVISALYFFRSRSAESWIGVSGFLIS